MPPETTTTITVSVEEEVEEAYLAYWAMLERLAQDPDPDDPEIAERATGEAREQLLAGVTRMETQGWRSEFGDRHGHDVISVMADDGQANVEHCAVDDSRVIDVETGETVREGVGTILYEATLEHTDVGWQVHSVSEADPTPGAEQCS